MSVQQYGRRRYRVVHLTRYSYDGVVEAVYNRALLHPRTTDRQTVLDSSLEITPEPQLVSDHLDYFGNHSTYVEGRRPVEGQGDGSTRLTVTCRSTVEVDRQPPDLAELDRLSVAEAAAVLAREADPCLLADFTLPSPLIGLTDAVGRYAAGILAPGRPLGQALQALVDAIFADFRYAAGTTSVLTTLDELLALRQGVCQDFAHLAVGCLRAAGLPARYVSGYLETEPPPGTPKLQGADASHAWAAVLTPSLGWLELDPTNAQWVDSRYVVTAWGRDFTDVSPLRGVVSTEATNSDLQVEVDVVPLRAD
ncbi:MAG: transglutaminase family protein [Propionicimonas sp.]|nr:transglutaminase family protein [Propionicimonas sp.]